MIILPASILAKKAVKEIAINMRKTKVKNFYSTYFTPVFYLYRISHRWCSVKKVFLEISQTGNYLFQGLFFKKVADPRPPSLFKKRLWQRCFTENFAKFLGNPFSIEYFRWLLLPFHASVLFLYPLKFLYTWTNLDIIWPY